MLKYLNYDVVLAEVPDEITLAINITNCPNHCIGCHSPYLADDIGEELTNSRLCELINNNKGITCISFMGGDSDPVRINSLAKLIKAVYNISNYKIAWYSGKEFLSYDIDLSYFDYIKLGPYKEEFGPLNKKTTNQRMYKVRHNMDGHNLEDITRKFWK